MKLNATQCHVLAAIKEAKRATKKQATADGGNHITIKKLIDLELAKENPQTRAYPETTFSVTAKGSQALKAQVAADKPAEATAEATA